VPPPRAQKAAPRAAPPQTGRPYGKSTSPAKSNVNGREKRQEAPIAGRREERPPAAAPPLRRLDGPRQGKPPWPGPSGNGRHSLADGSLRNTRHPACTAFSTAPCHSLDLPAPASPVRTSAPGSFLVAASFANARARLALADPSRRALLAGRLPITRQAEKRAGRPAGHVPVARPRSPRPQRGRHVVAPPRRVRRNRLAGSLCSGGRECASIGTERRWTLPEGWESLFSIGRLDGFGGDGPDV
jgi:hypothetical protein